METPTNVSSPDASPPQLSTNSPLEHDTRVPPPLYAIVSTSPPPTPDSSGATAPSETPVATPSDPFSPTRGRLQGGNDDLIGSWLPLLFCLDNVPIRCIRPIRDVLLRRDRIHCIPLRCRSHLPCDWRDLKVPFEISKFSHNGQYQTSIVN